MSSDLLHRILDDLMSALAHHHAARLTTDENGICLFDEHSHLLASYASESRLPITAQRNGYEAGAYAATLTESLSAHCVTLTQDGALTAA